ncbi:MAG: methyl-accepting chemotaxis protein [Cyanobacteria bacterium P01_A01_bin.116]
MILDSLRFTLTQKSPTRLLKLLYFATVATVVTLTVGGQVLTQKALDRQSKDAVVINIAGRQRMLSQKIAKDSNALQAAKLARQSQAIQSRLAKDDLRDALALFKAAHEGLQAGDDTQGLPGDNSEKVSEMFSQIADDYEAMVTAAETLLMPFQEANASASRMIASHEGAFLKQMNAIVGQYEQEATARVTRLKRTQQVLLLLTLLALLPVLLPIHQVTRRVESMIDTLQRAGIQVTSSSVQISASGMQLETMATEQAAASAQITASSQEIANSALSLNRSVEQIVEKAQHAQRTASQGEKELASMAMVMGELDHMTAQISQRLAEIRDRAGGIDQVVLTMTKIAAQTNLLSLNAAIEAEKAGEYGAGFSVVAREIRRLADQSAIATLDIEKLVKEMQSAVTVGVAETEHFTQQVTAGSSSTQVVTQQVSAIAQSVRSLLPKLAQVNQGMTSQSLSAEQIRQAMEQLSLGTDQTVQSLQETNHALALLQETAEQLQGSVRSLPVRQVPWTADPAARLSEEAA